MSVIILGHKSPDTDSVTAAIAFAELQKALGVDAVPGRQGELNPETALVLEKFGYAAPELVTDVSGRKYMLVDHSDIKQAPDNWDQGELMAIVDHHKIGDITTGNPIFFCAMPVGCTGTVLYKLYTDLYKKPIPEKVAGLMLSAILSDTVLFKSATCTPDDKAAAEALAKIAGISDMMAWGMEMAKAKSAVEGVAPRDLIFRDYKDFDMGGKTVGIGQLELVSLDLVADMKDALYAEMEKVKAEGNRHSVFLMLTDIMKEGTELLAATDDPGVVDKAFGTALQGRSVWLDGVMSRKKQMVPPLQKAFGA
ncbi:manganese-dependent inorganic pyrophosphatase [Dissulfurirhabdus thermomarina]|uniref:inorganic diphosphatase n=1 Tax=Dissulfurirhabdus thermomarina TaxID=1765737 RepID=A0A6N9TRE5_DISTH|nr:manganese-dependent inorganic pyrophosphatase [Dissulfurirhabdus thermomarina]NDY42007.1 manganese-dependent inorganic pyrophosphatase [Dissulfurirhabdus thermomarina]NMX24008.1 manganese-dependent inorganic pyrophosphatase [Dissulfurirhabdus thermomarina]